MVSRIDVKISPELNTRVSQLAKQQGKTISELVSTLLEEYVRNNDIGAYIDDLWARINRRLSQKGIDLSDIEKALIASRKKR